MYGTEYYSSAVAEAPVEERMAFLKKVYGLLAISLMTAASAAWISSTNEAFMALLRTPVYWGFVILEFVAIFFAMWARKKKNLGMIALFSVTILSGITITPIVARSSAGTVVDAFTLTALIFVSLSAYAIYSKKDFSFMGGMLGVGLIIVIVAGILNIFFRSPIGSLMISGASAFLFSGFILYDTSNIMREYPTDEYVMATLSLYLNILNLFLALLRILGFLSDD
ncbi:MAG: modulator of FtsH protease [bacterium]|jgi:modulator of FtsH protease